MNRENVYELARKAIALLILGFEPKKNESIESYVDRCERELRISLAKEKEYAESRA